MESSFDRVLASCPFCKHKDLGMATCSAYPMGIPADILAGRDKHNQPRGDDAGIIFTPLAKTGTIA